MAIITLTSDWGYRDHYLATVKGTILSLAPNVIIVDISHEIDHFNSSHAAFAIRNAFPAFPEGTIHIIGVNAIASIISPHVVVKHQGHYFIGADNGILSLITMDDTEEIYEIDIPSASDYFTFPSRDVFPHVAASIINGIPLSEIGAPKTFLQPMIAFEPIVTDDQLKGKVIYVDHYCNAITNISESLFRSFIKGRRYSIQFKSAGTGIVKVSASYDDVIPSEMLALFSSTGYLQIAINRGKASELLGLRNDESILVERYN